MPVSEIRFDDGASYERYMGVWSRLVGETFLSWLAPRPGSRWIDIGCGNGAFTQQIVERCAPAEVQGVDPSEAQLVFARSRPAARLAEIAKAMPWRFRSPTAASRRPSWRWSFSSFPIRPRASPRWRGSVRPGGMVATYAWDILGGGFPHGTGPGRDAWQWASRPCCRRASARPGWMRCGRYGPARASTAVETREISVQRTFADFDDFWTIILLSPSLRPMIAAMSSEDIAGLEARVQARLLPDAAGRITYAARANAIKGRVPR